MNSHPMGIRKNAPLVQGAQKRWIPDWETFRVLYPGGPFLPAGAVVDSRWVLAWEVIDGETVAKARLVVKGF